MEEVAFITYINSCSITSLVSITQFSSTWGGSYHNHCIFGKFQETFKQTGYSHRSWWESNEIKSDLYWKINLVVTVVFPGWIFYLTWMHTIRNFPLQSSGSWRETGSSLPLHSLSPGGRAPFAGCHDNVTLFFSLQPFSGGVKPHDTKCTGFTSTQSIWGYIHSRDKHVRKHFFDRYHWFLVLQSSTSVCVVNHVERMDI